MSSSCPTRLESCLQLSTLGNSHDRIESLRLYPETVIRMLVNYLSTLSGRHFCLSVACCGSKFGTLQSYEQSVSKYDVDQGHNHTSCKGPRSSSMLRNYQSLGAREANHCRKGREVLAVPWMEKQVLLPSFHELHLSCVCR